MFKSAARSAMNPADKPESPFDPFGTKNTYFCDPYHSRLEQYGLEYLDRDSTDDDEVKRVVILGYN